MLFHRGIVVRYSPAMNGIIIYFLDGANIQFSSISLHTECSEMPGFINELI